MPFSFLAGGSIRGIMQDVAKRFQYEFEWDPVKARQNLRKHRVAFERAATIFLDPDALSEFDEEEGSGEDRWITLGLDRTFCSSYAIRTEKRQRQVGG